MKSRSIVAAGILTAGIGIAALSACESTGEPPPHAWWLAAESASYCVQSPSVTLTLPEGQTGTLEFKDKNGHPVGPPSHLEGGITIEIPVPTDAVAYDWKVSKGLGEPAGPALAATSVAPPITSGGLFGAPVAQRPTLGEFYMGCLTCKFDPSSVNYAYALRATSADEDEAYGMMQDVLEGKVGSLVDRAVKVDAFLELSISGGRVKMVSSMPAEFASYTVDVGGSIVADLATGNNVTVTHGANGWISLTSTLPLSAVQAGSGLQLTQQAVGETEGATLTIY